MLMKRGVFNHKNVRIRKKLQGITVEKLFFSVDQTQIAQRVKHILGLMRGPFFDGVFLFVPFLLCLGTYSVLVGRPGIWGLNIAVVILFYSAYISTGHAMSTFSRVVWDKDSLKKYHWLLAVTPIVMGFLLYQVVDWLGLVFLMTSYFYLQWFHYVRQGYGLSQVYRHLNKINDPAWLHYSVIYGMALWGFAHRATTPDQVFLFQPMYTFPQLGWLEYPLAGFALATLAYWLIRRAVDFYNGRPVFGYTTFVLTHVAVFYLSLIYIQDPTIGWIGSAFWHGTQYIFFVWHFNKRQIESKGRTTNAFQWVALSAFIFVPAFFYFGKFTYWAWTSIQVNMQFAATTTIALNLAFLYNHYLADAILWRKQKQRNEEVKSSSS